MDYKTYTDKFNENKKDAASCNNCIHPPLLDINLQNVAPPYLHIVLGVVKKHQELLELAAHKIDKRLSILYNFELTDLGLLVKKLGTNWKLKVETKKKHTHLRTCRLMSDDQGEKDKYTKKISATKALYESISHEPLKYRSRPVAS